MLFFYWQEVNDMLTAASKARPGNDLFRTLGDNGESLCLTHRTFRPDIWDQLCDINSKNPRWISIFISKSQCIPLCHAGLISYTEYLFLLTILTSKSLLDPLYCMSCILRSPWLCDILLTCNLLAILWLFIKTWLVWSCFLTLTKFADSAEIPDNWRCVAIAEPRTGFHIAFKMLDVDGNEHVDKKEFLKVRWGLLNRNNTLS